MKEDDVEKVINDENFSKFLELTASDEIKMYDLVGITGQYTDNNYGWTNLRNAEPVRTRDGYMLKLPRAIPLK